MINCQSTAAPRAEIRRLVAAYCRNEADYLTANYNETQARTDYITPLLRAFGWDVHNTKGHQLALREVIEEATVEVGEERSHKKPDYELRLARQRKLFVEAKKPSVPIETDNAAAFQIRRYGYSANLHISVLTNFRYLAVYDCQAAPADTDAVNVSRRLLVPYTEFETRFDEIWPLLSRECVYSGEFDRQFASADTKKGTERFDHFFLCQIRRWRHLLAVDIARNTPNLTSTELTYLVQLFLSRIIFLRICEDRDIEAYETLRNLDRCASFAALMTELKRADAFYNSGLFRLIEHDGLDVRISDSTISTIVAELYYPESPYTFAVVEPEILGEIYEHFLADLIQVDGSAVEIVKKPEVRESGGVIPTPGYIAYSIAERTLRPLLVSKSPHDLSAFTVADICCGSGTFLLAAFEILLDHYLTWYLDNDRASHEGHRIYRVAAHEWRLTFDERRRILTTHIRGVDFDPSAVEVAQLSLLLKLIEGETSDALRNYVVRARNAALPPLDHAIRCGNSLVSAHEWRQTLGTDPPYDELRPFTWATEFAQEMSDGGFAAIIGNPPYVRIQNMAKYSRSEVEHFRHRNSPYAAAEHDNFDKYLLFVERSIGLVGPSGRVGMIVPQKFTTIQSGRALRRLIAQGRLLREFVHFGAKQVFGPDASNYTCIIILDRSTTTEVRLERPKDLDSWRYGALGAVDGLMASELRERPWRFADAETRGLFDRIKADVPYKLDALAEIFVGLQTSADEVYLFESSDEDAETCTLRWDHRDWRIERGVLRPSLLDVQLRQFARPQSNSWIIFPYELLPGRSGIVKPHLIQPAAMAARYPNCWAYLNSRRSELEARSVSGGLRTERQWYQYGRSQSLSRFDGDKIVVQVLSTEPRYAYDDSNIFVTGGGNGPYYLIRPRPKSRISIFYLLAVLNHPLSEAFVRTETSVFRGGYYSHGKQFIQTLPIPIAEALIRTEIEDVVAALIARFQALSSARIRPDRALLKRETEDLRRELRGRVDQVFGLSASDVGIVDSVPIPD